MKKVSQEFLSSLEEKLLKKYPQEKERIQKGLKQVAEFWDVEKDGQEEVLEKFALEYFVTGEEWETFFNKLNQNYEYLIGYLHELMLKLREPIDLDIGELTKFDLMFANLNLSAHLEEDFFKEKIAFAILLNFPKFSLKEKEEKASGWNNHDWAYAKMADSVISRVPPEKWGRIMAVLNKANSYIMHYNIFGESLLTDGENLFPKGLKMISHWNLRDEIKALYGKTDHQFEKQKTLYQALERITTQEIPQEVINNPQYQWDPEKNRLYREGKEVEFKSENNVRYRYLKDSYLALRELDPFYPDYPTAIKRKFELERELSEETVLDLFDEILSSSVTKEVARLISQRLGRKLEAWDIWYDGFKARSNIDEQELDKIVGEKYKTPQDFQNDIPNILTKLGFSQEQINFVAPKIVVDNARGAGHAFGTQLKSGKSHLRTRIPETGMDYKGYNIAIHELGHNVEQTFSLHKTPYYIMRGIPFTAFTEAFAFLFQKRDLDILGLGGEKTQEQKYLEALDAFWNAYEMIGISLVDYEVWKWMYQTKDFTAEALKNATLEIAKKIWNRYYAPVLGVKDQVILAVYSHMISSPLYLADYPIGRIISFQIDKFMEGKNLGKEMERMCSIGSIAPQEWMKKAVGSVITAKPLLKEVKDAIDFYSSKEKSLNG